MRIVQYTYPTTRSFAPAFTGFDRLFATAYADSSLARSAFPVELYQDKDNAYVLRAELPGVPREEISVELTEGVLTVAVTPKAKAGEEKSECASDCACATSSRSVDIPEDVQTDKMASANYENGVLKVTLPKSEPVKPQKIQVEVK